ncbi:DUF4132 domain-containing protein [Cohnella sp. AR92]|uniref:DUF4132 domain-containing protein n=1 Tax=Cohnella sp. AR92 TaxID=648716 RepID=UPI000F8C8150|nr:DUF4132 domain-containing protein [Cohnella sp. AR92]RUS43326.1 DUF4132 domain-containing protein [Cohnella sp. AR92]
MALVMEGIDMDGHQASERTKKLESLIAGHLRQNAFYREPRIADIAKILDRHQEEGNGDSYFEPLIAVLKQHCDDYLVDVYRYVTERLTEYPYSTGYMRKPFRTKNVRVHVERAVYHLFALYDLSRLGFSLMEYLTRQDQADHGIIAYVLAYELDRDNREVYEALQEICFGENNTALLNRAMIRGIVHSHHSEAHQLLGQMLIAARLQEGLRQSILESMDDGTIEAFRYLLQVIIEQELIRYSSVVRALDVWTGLALEAANTRVVKQCVEYAQACLNDERLCQEWAGSTDVHKLYFALWGTAVREEEQLPDLFRQIREHGSMYQQIVAQYFLARSQNDKLRFALAIPYLEAAHTDLELQSLVLSNYGNRYADQQWYDPNEDPETSKPIVDRITLLENKAERLRHFELFRKMLDGMPKPEVTGKSRVFDWMTYSVSADDIANRMLYLAAYDLNPDLISQMIGLKDRIGAEVRGMLLRKFVRDASKEEQRRFLLESLSDKSLTIRENALHRIAEFDLTAEELERVQDLLKLKTGSLRQSAMKVLLKQPPEQVERSIKALLANQMELPRLGALEMLCVLKEDKEQASLFGRVRSLASMIQEPTDKERPLVERLRTMEQKGLLNGFGGLYDPNQGNRLPPLSEVSDETARGFFQMPIERIQTFLQGLSDLIHEHREYEYTVDRYGGQRESYLLGAHLERLNGYHRLDPGQTHLEQFPLSDAWEAYLRKSGLTVGELSQLAFYFAAESDYRYLGGKRIGWDGSWHEELGDWGKEFYGEIYPAATMEAFYEESHRMPYRDQVRSLVLAFYQDSDKAARFSLASALWNRILHFLREKKLVAGAIAWERLSEPWQSWAEDAIYDDRTFAEYFSLRLTKDKLTANGDYHLDLEKFVRARDLDIIDDEELYQELLAREHRSQNHMRTMTWQKGNFEQKHPTIRRFKEKVLKVILELELNRGDLPTDVSELAMGIDYFEGLDTFSAILTALDKEAFVRGYIYSGHTKKEALSHLLRVCHPAEGDNVQRLKDALKGKKISEKRLLEAAMYAPQWLELVSEYLGWKGLRSAAWYFHAHVNEHFSAEKETIVAHYSPISPADLNDGAFDIAWFKEAYEELGEKRFNVLYQCAKYISAGANHRRSQLFADAVLGRLDPTEMKATIQAKRNRDHLLSYSLIPIGSDRGRDVLERYEFIQQFLKESKSFGSMRSANESKAAAVALENLARNAGYSDIVRLKWEMEARKIEEIRPMLEPEAVEDMEARIAIDENGRAELEISRDGKPIKSLPSKASKHPYIVTLKETIGGLREQYRRARVEFERSMEAGDGFTGKELANLAGNPVLAPILHKLVFQCGDRLGFYENGRLVGVPGISSDASGAIEEIAADELLVIAHPLHLYRSGEWSLYQKHLFDKRIKQPFKQVFRELYLLNADERESGASSGRYAGHQVQPKRAAALLKSRQWTVSYEEGLQKVYHKENIIVQLYARADWFSPSEVEAPTLEAVTFLDRRTYEPVELSRVPALVFSEAMRDVDLVVSTAHVGGVDPEASLTTIELRKAIVTESLRLLKIANVRLEGNFARISGSLGEYGVHLGSGSVQKMATGSLFILAVHSQHRGRLFLPFMDEDPKTAEILSKIVMLAQDTKIKDPQILEQLRS